MYKGIKIRLYPNKEQKVLLNEMFGNDRHVWNLMLGMINQRYQNNHSLKLPSAFDLNMLLPLVKQEEPFLKLSPRCQCCSKYFKLSKYLTGQGLALINSRVPCVRI